ncbi:hypothetical protein, partial [Neobacillus drentensis]|uniref:hypothetical protein n=1 Tax=Neobacillus drentensis TaxID=220684 RepID=UPI002FFEB733
KCLSEGHRWTKRGKEPGKTSIGRKPMDITGQGNRQNVHREGSDGQNCTRKQENVYREEADGQNHTRELAKRLSGGSDGQNGPRNQVKCLSEGSRWTKRPKEPGKMSIAKVTMDKTT